MGMLATSESARADTISAGAWLDAIGRRKKTVSFDQASADAATAGHQLEPPYPDTNTNYAHLSSI